MATGPCRWRTAYSPPSRPLRGLGPFDEDLSKDRLPLTSKFVNFLTGGRVDIFIMGGRVEKKKFPRH